MCITCARMGIDPFLVHGKMAQTSQNQAPPTAQGQLPYIAGPLPGVPNQGMPTQPGQVGHAPMQNVGGITVVNSTGDPRIIWEDGKFAIIHARDFPANTGMGRSSTRKTVPEAMIQAVDPARQTAVGPGSLHDFCKVVLSELLARPLNVGQVTKPTLRPGRPAPKPMIASGYGHVAKGTVIPDGHFPHICGMCGDWYYQGTGEHASTPDGRCSSQKPKKK